MLNGYLTRRHTIALLAVMAVLLSAALLLAYAGVPQAEAQSPPAKPASLTLSRADGTVTANWPAVNGVTKYHVTYTTNGGGSWHAPVDNHTDRQTNSITFNGDNSKTYIVGVRAGNNHGWKLPIPRYDDGDSLHVRLSELGKAAEQECAALIAESDIMSKPAGDAQSRAARRLLRHGWQPQSQTAQMIESSVAVLLSDPAQAALAERQMSSD